MCIMQECPILFLEGRGLAEFSTNLNYTQLNQLNKVFRLTRNFQVSDFELVGNKICKIPPGTGLGTPGVDDQELFQTGFQLKLSAQAP